MNTVIVTQNKYSFNIKFKVDGSSNDFQDMLSDFKTSIGNRKWNPIQRVWEVPNLFEKELRDWCLNSEWWDDIIWNGTSLKGTSSQKTSYQSNQKTNFKSSADSFEDFIDLDTVRKENETLYSVLYLTPEAPIELVEKVWKALMMLYHPDKGGDTARAAAINAAYQKIKEDLK